MTDDDELGGENRPDRGQNLGWAPDTDHVRFRVGDHGQGAFVEAEDVPQQSLGSASGRHDDGARIEGEQLSRRLLSDPHPVVGVNHVAPYDEVLEASRDGLNQPALVHVEAADPIGRPSGLEPTRQVGRVRHLRVVAVRGPGRGELIKPSPGSEEERPVLAVNRDVQAVEVRECEALQLFVQGARQQTRSAVEQAVRVERLTAAEVRVRDEQARVPRRGQLAQ